MNGNRHTLAIEFGRRHKSIGSFFFEELAAEWRIWGYRLALKITGCPEAASDALQEALVRTFRAQRQLSEADSPRAWFRKVLVRCAIDQSPKTARFTDRGEANQNDESAIYVRQVLRSLAPNHRAILALAIGEELSYREISELLDIPIGTVGSRLHHAKTAFRRAWGED